MTILRKRIIFQHKDYPRGKTLPNLYAKRQFRVLVSLIYQNTRRVCSVDRAEKALNHKDQGFLLKIICVFLFA